MFKHRFIIFLFAILFISLGHAQNGKSIKVFFLYGSRPAHPNVKHEKRYFGGIHGGHVSFGIDSVVVGFTLNNYFHIFPHKKRSEGIYQSESIRKFVADSVGSKYTTFVVPISDSQYVKLKRIFHEYLFVKSPYDYAFLGMRCASASYEVMGMIGLFKLKSRMCNVLSNFYPKKVRKKMFKLAKANNYKIIKQQGRSSRKWERD